MDMDPAEPRIGHAENPVQAAQGGDPEALTLVWHEHRRWLAAVLTAHRPRGVEVADLLQEVAMTLVAKIGTLEDPEAIRPWLRRVAVNIARTAARRDRPTLRLVGQEGEAVEAPDMGDQAERSELYREVLQHMAELPVDYREPLMLRAVKGMSYRCIADVLGVPITTVETRIARARRMLREQLSESLPANVVGTVTSTGAQP
ncbi:MAG: sigma-70 family RNA polymerase sigma factor [Phycisphaerales bacterium]|nr:sigma-70 family RNA polymerase sigma factor [Phycisphaerales bacterium]